MGTGEQGRDAGAAAKPVGDVSVWQILKIDYRIHKWLIQHRKEISAAMTKFLGTYGPKIMAIAILLVIFGQALQDALKGDWGAVWALVNGPDMIGALTALGLWHVRPKLVTSEQAKAGGQ